MADLVASIRECVQGAGGHVWVATAGRHGEPHLAIASCFGMADERTATITGLCCLKSVDNLRENNRLTIGVWNSRRDEGWQLVGSASHIEVAAKTADGGEAAPRDATHAEYTITVAVSQALHLVSGQHSDSAI